MSTVNLSAFGPLESSAHHLLDYARTLVQSGQALDVMHVMLAALAPSNNGHSADHVAVAALDAAGVSPETVRTLLDVELRVHSEPLGAADGLTEAMRRCVGVWRQKAAEHNLRITNAVILWAVLAENNAVTQRIQALGAKRTAMLEELESHFQPVLPAGSSDTQKLPPRLVPASLGPEDALAYSRATSLLHVTQITPDLHYRGMHAVLMANVLNVLGSCEAPDFVVLAGRNGTPFRAVSLVLAERLAANETFTDERARLSHYHMVYRLDIESVRRLANIPDEPEPQDVLQMAFQHAAEDQAVLVLDHLEALSSTLAVDRTLLAQLSNPGDALVLGLYEMAERNDPGVENALDLQNMRRVAAREYSAAQTRALLFDYYVPLWQARGFTFEPDAFDSVIALEPGSWIELKRKTLPYLVVGLARDTMQTVNEGRSLILDTARMALDALEALKFEWATTDERVRDRFSDVLAQALSDVEGLISDPQVRTDKGKKIISRAHVVAQLTCPNDSEFHYPGHAPRELHRNFDVDLPAHLQPHD